jgi:hypothetical protein
MRREIPEKLRCFLENAVNDVEDGDEYWSELNHILNSSECQGSMSIKEIDALRDYADDVKQVGEINSYTIERISEIERERFGSRGIIGYLNSDHGAPSKPVWPF